MSSLFLSVANASIRASWIILAVLALRLVLKNAPGWFRMGCWALVGLRLILPFSIESKLSLLPSSEPIGAEIMLATKPAIYSGVSSIDNAVNPLIQQAFTPNPGVSMNPLQFWIPVFAATWLLGTAALIVYMCLSFYRLRRRVDDAALTEGNIYCSEKVISPFVLGIFRPRIYLPTQMWDMDKEYVLSHEQAHLRRLDHWWKPLGFVLLAIHWFNPLVWLSYALFCRDLEFSCDEAVIKTLEPSQRADYSQALLNSCAERNRIAACPLAFGEIGVKERVKGVLNYKKPAVWVTVIAGIAIIFACVCLLTNPAKVVPTSPIGEDLRNPDYVFAFVGTSSGMNQESVSEEAKDTIIPMIFDHKYTLLKEIPYPDMSSAKTQEEKIKMIFDYDRTFPDGAVFQESDFATALHIDFSYGPTKERWSFYSQGIQRKVFKSNRDVVTYWYRTDLPFWLQIRDWYEDMVLPSPEDLINRTY